MVHSELKFKFSDNHKCTCMHITIAIDQQAQYNLKQILCHEVTGPIVQVKNMSPLRHLMPLHNIFGVRI